MSRPASRQELIDFCLRKLGEPVIQINISEDQLNDRLDDALQYMQNYHMDGVERVYLKHMITASQFTITTNNAEAFEDGETLIGQTSGATCHAIQERSSGNTLRIKAILGDFVGGETIVGSKYGTTATLAQTNFLVRGDVDNGYIPLSDAVIGVNRIIPFTDTKAANINMFDVRYQLRLNDLFDLYSTSVIYYTQVQQHLRLLDMMLVGEKPIRFNRHMNRLYVDMDWFNYVKPDQIIIAECHRILDPDTFTDVYNDEFLKRYLTSLIKRQWGQNMSKYDGIEMPGGVKLNGWQIFDQGDKEVQQLEQEMIDKYQEPPKWFVG